jgi:ABC-type uncharacterized transport system auxiliary subunit
MHRANALRVVCFSGLLAGLAGCAGKIQYPNYYVLNLPAAPAPSGKQAKPLLGSVSVRNFSAPPFLRAGAIVYRDSPEQVNFYQYHRWAVDPRTSVTNAMLQNLQARGMFESVAEFDGRESSDYLMTGRLDQLEEVDKGHEVRVHVGISAQLMNTKTGDVVWSDSASEVLALEHRTVPGVVAEMSEAIQLSVAQLVSSMEKRAELMSPSVVHRDVEQP